MWWNRVRGDGNPTISHGLPSLSSDRVFREGDGEPLQPAENHVVPPNQRFRLQLQVRKPPQKSGKGDLSLKACEGRAKAIMTGPAECHMAVILAGQIETVRVGKTCRSEEHTSELQSHVNLVCRLLL